MVGVCLFIFTTQLVIHSPTCSYSFPSTIKQFIFFITIVILSIMTRGLRWWWYVYQPLCGGDNTFDLMVEVYGHIMMIGCNGCMCGILYLYSAWLDGSDGWRICFYYWEEGKTSLKKDKRNKWSDSKIGLFFLLFFLLNKIRQLINHYN